MFVTTSANAVTVAWNPQTFDVVNSSFNTATMTFAGFTATDLDSILSANTSAAIYHAHTGSMTATIELRIDNAWTTIFTDTITSSDGNVLIANTFTGASFSSGTVDGIRLSSAPQQNQSFHNWLTTTSTTPVIFDFSSAAVPIPAAVWLFGSGLLGLVGMARRKKT